MTDLSPMQAQRKQIKVLRKEKKFYQCRILLAAKHLSKIKTTFSKIQRPSLQE
jgi:hypothetical protein